MPIETAQTPFQSAFGVLLVVIAVILLLAGVNVLDLDRFISGRAFDVFLSFIVLALGLTYVFGFFNQKKE